MAKDFDKEDGVWRTIGGRKVFIRKGQSVADAMIESGKFKGQKNKPGMRESYRKEIDKIEDERKEAKSEEQRLKYEGNLLANRYSNAKTDDDRKYIGENWNNARKWEKEQSDKVANYDAMLDKENTKTKQLEKSREYDKEHGKAEPLREQYRQDYDLKKQSTNNKNKSYDVDMSDTTTEEYDKRSKEIGFPRSDEHGNYRLEKNGEYTYKMYDEINELKPFKEALRKAKDEEQERLDIARDIAKEMYQLNDKNSTQEKIDRYARDIMEYTDGEVTNETPYKDKNGNIQRSTQSLRDWREKLNKTKESSQSTNDYKVSNGNPVEDLISKKGINVGGRLREVDDEAKELFKTINDKNLNDEQAKFMLHSKYYDSNEDNLLDKYKEWKRENQSPNETMNNAIREKASNKYAGTKRWGFGYANDDNIPVYDNKIDYGGDFSHANLSSVSDSELKELYEKQSQLYNEAVNRGVGDRRTHNGRQSQIIKDVDLLRYGNGIQKVEEEMSKRGIKSNNMSEIIRREANLKNAFRQYKREHPESKMTLNQFKKMNK